MKQLSKHLCLGFILFFPFITSAGEVWNNEYLVKLKPVYKIQKEFNVFKTLRVKVENTIPQLNIAVCKMSDKKYKKLTIKLKKRKSRSMRYIEYIEPNYRIKLIEPEVEIKPPTEQKDKSQIGRLYGMRVINVEGAWEIHKGSKDVVVAVSDTGVFMHSDLVDNLWKNPGETGVDENGKYKERNGIDDDDNGYIDDVLGWCFTNTSSNAIFDRFYHGTHVTGIVGAVGDNNRGIVGVAWRASIMTVPFLDRYGGSDADAIRTIIYAADNGAKALNCSWGGEDFSQALLDAVDYAASKNMLIVAAAGNGGVSADEHPEYPSAYDHDNIISVGSSARNQGYVSSFSNYGIVSVDLAAPGTDIYSTYNPMYNSNRNFYYYLSGTSMATPHVTGAIALIYSANPNLTASQVKEILMTTVTPNEHWKGKSVSEGILNVEAAVKKAVELIESE